MAEFAALAGAVAGTGATIASTVAPVAGVGATIFGTALQAQAAQMRAQETARAAAFEQRQMEIQAERMRTAAAEAEARRRRELTSAMQTIEAIRAGRGVGSQSPTAMAIFDELLERGDRDILIGRANLLTRADTARMAAELAGGRAGTALLAGRLGAASSILSGVSSLARPYLLGGAGSGGAPGLPLQL
jgi:hypothetical protein